MNLPAWWRRIVLAASLVVLFSTFSQNTRVAEAVIINETSGLVGQVNALFMGGFYRGNGDDVQLTVINPNARKDGLDVEVTIFVYGKRDVDTIPPLGCGVISLAPNEISKLVDLDDIAKQNASGIDDFGSVLLVVTASNKDFLGTSSAGKKGKLQRQGESSPERGVVAYVSQVAGGNTHSQVRLWPFVLGGNEIDQLRDDFPNSADCDEIGAAKAKKS